MTPFKAVYGRDPPTLLPVSNDDTAPTDLLDQLQERDRVLDHLKSNLLKAQGRMKHYADRHRTNVSFQVGDWVLVKLQPYRQHSVRLQRHQKLGLRYFGPFQITKQIGSVAYRLLLPAEARIHPVFHVSLLKKYNGDSSHPYLPLPLVSAPERPLITPVQVIAINQPSRNGSHEPQLLIDWGEAAPPSWEPLSIVQQHYPSFDLGDKV